MKLRLFAATVAIALSTTVGAETRLSYKSAKSASSYYQMAVQVAEAVKTGTDNQIQLTVEESQGSVQNVKEASRRGENYVFTSPPSLIGQAADNQGPFEDGKDYKGIRALFPIPSLTMHFVVSEASGVATFDDLAGKDFITGKGSFGARKAEEVFKTLGLDGKINLVDTELDAAVPALQNRKVAGFATAGSYPAPNVMEVAAGTPIRLLGLDDSLIESISGTRLVIPGGTYPGVDDDTTTLSLPVAAYTLASMSDDTAYALTKAFWDNKDAMAETNRWWQGVTPELLASLGAELHPGAIRYYQEAGIELPEAP